MPQLDAILADLVLPDRPWPVPVLIGIVGLPGTGKTYLAQQLAQHHALVVLSTDVLRLRYSFASGPATHAVMAEVARTLLAQRRSVVWDGLPLGRQERAQVRHIAQQQGAHLRLVYTWAQPGVVAHRLRAREDTAEQTRAMGKFVITPEHFQRIASYFEAPSAAEDVITIDTSDDALVAQLAHLEAELATWWRVD